MAAFNLENFKSAIADRGVAWSDRYEIQFYAPNCLEGTDYDETELATLYAEHVNLPGMVITNKRQQIFGPSDPRPMSMDFGGENLTITFLADSQMDLRDMFDYWVQCIIDPDNYTVAYQEDYTATLFIKLLDKSDNEVYSVKIEDCYPFMVSPIDVNASAQNSVARFTVSFAYRKWKNEALPSFGENASQNARETQVKVTTFTN